MIENKKKTCLKGLNNETSSNINNTQSGIFAECTTETTQHGK